MRTPPLNRQRIPGGSVPREASNRRGFKMQKRVLLIAGAAVLALATWLVLARKGYDGAREPLEGEGPQGREDARVTPSPRLAAAPTMAQEPHSTSPPPGSKAPEPTLPPRSRVTGIAHLPEGEKASSWHVIWRRAGSRAAVSTDIRDDGSFELANPDPAAYRATLRPRTALWPSVNWQKGATAGSGGLLEPEALSAFRLQVEGALPADHPTAVQVESFEGVPILQLAVQADNREVEIAGIEDQHRYGIYVGPTSDGLYGTWQGVPKAGERVTVSLRQGARLRGRVDSLDDVEPASRRVDLHAFIGADVDVPVSESGAFEQAGLDPTCLWKVVATGRSRAGKALRAEATWRPDATQLVLRLEPAKD